MRLVCATVQMSSTHPLLNTAIQFDWSIVDEAGQVSQPAILGPLLLSSKFCLVGDHYQLPPLVNSAEALNKGMDVSLFRRLAEHHPQAISALTYQYRMNEGILLVCNTLIYSHRLRCANAEVAHAKFQLPSAFPITLNDDFNAKKWLWPCLHPSRSVILLNTDSLDKVKSTRTVCLIFVAYCAIEPGINVRPA